MAPVGDFSLEWTEVDEVAEPVQNSLHVPPPKETRRQLLEAVRIGDALALRALVLRRGAPLLTRCSELPGPRPGNLVDWALHHNRPDMAVRLLKISDSVGLSEELACGAVSAVRVAAQRGLADVLQALLSRGAAAINVGDDGMPELDADDSPLLLAALRGHKEAVAALISAGAWPVERRKEEVVRCARAFDFMALLPPPQLSAVRAHGDVVKLGRTAKELRVELEEAILAGNHLAVEDAVRRGASLAAHYRSDKAAPRELSSELGTGQPHMPHSAASSSSSAVPRSMFVNPVDWAALEGCPKVALRLLELGDEALEVEFPASPPLAPGCRHAVHIAAWRAGPPRWLSLLNGLLERGADSAQVDPWGRSALHLAVMRGHSEAAEALVQHGAWQHEAQRAEVLKLAVGQRIPAVIDVAGAGTSAASQSLPVLYSQGLAAKRPVADVAAVVAVEAPSSSSCGPKAVPDLVSCEKANLMPSLSDSLTREELDAACSRLLRDLSVAIKRGDVHRLRLTLGCCTLPLSSVGGTTAPPAPLTPAAGALLASADVELPGCGGLRGNLLDLAAWHASEAVALAILELAGERGLASGLAQGARHAVLWAVQQDALALLERLLSLGAKPCQTTEGCGSALKCAVEQSRARAAALLLHAGAWECEPEKEQVLQLLEDRGLLKAVDIGSGRGIGLGDPAAREELTAALLASGCHVAEGHSYQQRILASIAA
eukprot:TRINITY_DN81587_c0_g1_i1.p1 TRINITY_DN81587_c0_g1~~TRINITY_DN81587_c0_g1_i1.p1  ORF type:complete len:718 (+),score=167.36 TRINITY_DN81587_c0_g1_i1:121-2274(+)